MIDDIHGNANALKQRNHDPGEDGPATRELANRELQIHERDANENEEYEKRNQKCTFFMSRVFRVVIYLMNCEFLFTASIFVA